MSKARTALDETSTTGEFKRTEAGFRSVIEKGGRFEPEAGRYHLYVSLACPWACRCLATLYLKGLDHAIGVSVTHPTWQRTRPDDPKDEHTGWVFRAPSDAPLASSTGFGSFGCEGCVPDDVNGAKFVRDLYDLAKDTTGKYSVPVLWDKKEKTIVNNESSEILRMFNSAFNDIATNPGLDLYPEPLRPAIDELNAWVYPTINNGVYRCGFATTQAAYEAAFEELFGSLDRVEGILSRQRYLAGDSLTEADVRLFQTLIRFDEVYVVYFKTNKRFLREYPNIAGYVRELFQTPGLGRAVNMFHIKTHYFTSHPRLNYYAVVPRGGEAWWEQPHDRAERFGGAKQA
ncbi:hypothetical protein GPECTOR_161g124 [Gonium pectorale]|uniref:GST C-terminal domain-containing protein n=1 Tax=Gonium pectorale TaxID=33097 RepID=A0A150FYP4_GONPE|nr:hypothetical protein GPECTOR_161g124 [Gonium pectorale]|eukprot:KXZ42325.1 hypothetical protein GPECTOR_161g124 [Gonium pectorale]